MSERQSVGVEVQHVDLSYGTNHILKDVSLSVRSGEFFAFLGPSGCGKTTLLRLIAGFNQADRGEVRLGGTDISHLPPWRRDVGMVFQSYALWPHMTVARNVAFGLEERKIARAEIAPKVQSALALVGLEALADRYPSQLSGGQQQRVALARTIAVEPKVLLLDEPLSNLDAKMRVQVRRELRDLQQRLGLTTIFVTHDQEEANSICDRIAVLNDGVVQQVGTPMELYQRPANLFVAGFLGTANILSGRIAENGSQRVFAVKDGPALPLPSGSLATKTTKLVFRPQHASINPEGSPGLAGTIAHREFLGAIIRYGVSIAGSEILVESPFASADGLRDVGSPVSVSVDVARVHFLDA
jgi:iron(III) transport system ATP-binding protein